MIQIPKYARSQEKRWPDRSKLWPFRRAKRRSSRRLQFAGQILELARRDGIKPGERMFEHRLAQRLGVSRGPVRTGLQQLAASGLASVVPNKGYVLTKSLDSDVARATMATASALEAQYMTIADDRLEGRLPDVVSEKELMRRYSLKRPGRAASSASHRR